MEAFPLYVSQKVHVKRMTRMEIKSSGEQNFRPLIGDHDTHLNECLDVLGLIATLYITRGSHRPWILSWL